MVIDVLSVIWNCIDTAWEWLRFIFYSFGITIESLIIAICVCSAILFLVVKPFVGERRTLR